MALDPGSIVCKLVTTGETVCSQVQAQVGPIAAFLDKWQSLLGAFLGAVIGIVGALIVARSATLRSRKLAANLLLPDLKRYMSAGARVNEDLEKPEYIAISRLKVVSIKSHKPKSIHLHASEINDVMDLDSRLWAHLMNCQQLDRDLDVALEKYAKAEEEAREAERTHARVVLAPSVDGKDVILALRDAALNRLLIQNNAVEKIWDHCVEHATLANYYLGQFIYGRLPAQLAHHRMKLWPNDFDRRSKHLIFKGSVLSAQSSENVTDPGQSTLTTADASTSSSGCLLSK